MVLAQYKEDIAVCPVSFTITNDKSAIEIDHFYPKTEIYRNVDRILDQLELEGVGQIDLLKEEIKALLPDGKRSDLALINSLTNRRHLKVLFGNEEFNLWPISKGVNASLGKKNHTELISKTFNTVTSLAQGLAMYLNTRLSSGSVSISKHDNNKKSP